MTWFAEDAAGTIDRKRKKDTNTQEASESKKETYR